jgi:hypothetical protein
MEKIKTILFFLLFSIALNAQDTLSYQKKLATELSYDTTKNELVFTMINLVDTAITIPAFSVSRNTYTIYYPTGDEFLIPDLGTYHWLLTVEPKKNEVKRQNFPTLLTWISESTSNRKKQKHLKRTAGTYKIEWLIDGLPPKTIAIDYKDKE